jgi:hypothetical protein
VTSSVSEARRHGRVAAVLWTVGVAVLAALYFFQSSTLAPNHTDEGLIIQYIDSMAHGDKPFFDFVDAYGLLNWIFPVAFYEAFGNRVWGVRMWMIVLKLLTLGAAYVLTRALASGRENTTNGSAASSGGFISGRFYAAFAVLWTAILLGAQWQSLQTAYAFVTVMPMTLAAWYFLVEVPPGKERRNVVLASLLTAATIWTKLNTGMYLLAGGLFTYFFWLPVPSEDAGQKPRENAAASVWLTRARAVGAVAYGVLFTLSMRQHFNGWFFLYLFVPLTICVAWALYATVARAPKEVRALAHLRPFGLYLALTLGVSLVVLFGYYGRYAGMYVKELTGILSWIHYTAAFPPLGKPGSYIGLNEYYWLQLPIAVTALFVLWLVLGAKFGSATFGEAWPRRRAQVSSVFMLLTLHTFVMYARCDETHIFQALVLSVSVFFVLLAQVDLLLHQWRSVTRMPLRLATFTLGVFLASTLFVVPRAAAFELRRGDWWSPKLEHLLYREKFGRYVRDVSPNLFDHDWDIAEDDAAHYIKSVSLRNEDVLLLTANRLLYFNSETKPIGGRYQFFFYLISVGLLDREGFDHLVPRRVVDDILERPPRIIVSQLGIVPIADAFPELQYLRDNAYVQTHHFRHILIYELRINGAPVPYPLR